MSKLFLFSDLFENNLFTFIWFVGLNGTGHAGVAAVKTKLNLKSNSAVSVNNDNLKQRRPLLKDHLMKLYFEDYL
jgi:adenylylsulfate kinase-like enzyme